MITLYNRHIIIPRLVAEQLFENAAQVNWVFYAERNTLLIASQYDEDFKALHKTSMSMLKHKNSLGDRSLSAEELLIDHDLDNSNRTLEYKADENMKILTIILSPQTIHPTQE